MGRCRVCGRLGITVSNAVGVCADCLRARPEDAVRVALETHGRFREGIGLPRAPPRTAGGIKCGLCVNHCVLGNGEVGYCGMWRNVDGRLIPVIGRDRFLVHVYYDPLPTNCVATPVCPAYLGTGYLRFAKRPSTEYGYYNLAVFLGSCNLDCLFCQNYEHKYMLTGRIRLGRLMSIDELVKAAMDPRVTCVCYFGGDPTPQILQAIEASRTILRKAGGEVKRICWETNGLVSPGIMRVMGRLSLESGGIVKIDWKAWTPSIYTALTGVNGEDAVRRLMENTKLLAEMSKERPEIPLLVVSTLLVPGYVDEREVEAIASYLAQLNPEIPYVLLAYHPDHLMRDLPTTSINHAVKAINAARRAGLKNVYLGNEWLLGHDY